MNDYLELTLYLEDEEDDNVSLHVFLKDKSLLVFSGVRADPVRYKGWWSINHVYLEREVASYVPAENVSYFTIVRKYHENTDNGQQELVREHNNS